MNQNSRLNAGKIRRRDFLRPGFREASNGAGCRGDPDCPKLRTMRRCWTSRGFSRI
jgi:hypothetical protein